ncbi:MAG: DUF2231 domain-containing protein [Pacificimonas sp.]
MTDILFRRSWAAFVVLAFLTLALPGPLLAHGPGGHGGETAETDAAETPAALETDASETPEAEGESPVSAQATENGQQVSEAGRHSSISTKKADASLLKSLHPATVHFPIALLLAAALAEFWFAARSGGGGRTTVRFLVWTGAAGAIVAALFGWIHTGLWFGGEDVMQWHRWTGTGIAGVSILLGFLSGTGGKRTIFRLLLSITAVAIVLQGFWGGELAHGANHLGIF